MKKIILLAAIVFTAHLANAQYYSTGINALGRINVFGGITNDLTGSTTFLLNKPYFDGLDYFRYQEVEPKSISHDMGAGAGIDISMLRDQSDIFYIGVTAGFFGSKGKTHAILEGKATGNPYDAEIERDYNQMDIHIGVAGLVYVVPEKVSIDFSLSPGFFFSFGDQVKYTLNPAPANDVDNGVWHKAEHAEDMAYPSIDIMALARIGVSYHFTEKMWVGALFQYRLPIAAFGFGDEEYLKDEARIISNDFLYVDRKHRNWAALLTWGIDLD